MTNSFAALLDTAGWLLPAAAVVGVVLLISLAWSFLIRYVKPTTPEEKKGVVSLLLQMLGGVAFVLGAWFTWQELKTSRDALLTTQQGQITERFTRAVEQLGKVGDGGGGPPTASGASAGADRNLAVRLGGIYALERISKDSKEDYPAVMEVLTAFVREHALWAGDTQEAGVRPDVQAILTVLGRRGHSYGRGESERLDLSATDLRGAALIEANLVGANLKSAHFENANLSRARLNGALLSDARFNEGSILAGAVLRDCDLRGASLKGADVTGADFTGADLSSADLREARGLTAAQLNSAKSRDRLLTDPPAEQKP